MDLESCSLYVSSGNSLDFFLGNSVTYNRGSRGFLLHVLDWGIAELDGTLALGDLEGDTPILLAPLKPCYFNNTTETDND